MTDPDIIRVIVPAEPAIIRVLVPGPPGPSGSAGGGDAVTEANRRPRVDKWNDLTGLDIDPLNMTVEAMRRDASSEYPMPAVFRDAGIVEPGHSLWRLLGGNRYFEYVPQAGMVDCSQVGMSPDRDGGENWAFLKEAASYARVKKAGILIPAATDIYAMETTDGSLAMIVDSDVGDRFCLLGGGMWQTQLKRTGDCTAGFFNATDKDYIRIGGLTFDMDFPNMPQGPIDPEVPAGAQYPKPHAFRGNTLNDFEWFDMAWLNAAGYGGGLQTQTGTFKHALLRRIRIYNSRLDGIDWKDEANGNEELILENIYINNHNYTRGDGDGAGIDLRGIARVNGVYCDMDDDAAEGFTVRTRPEGFEDNDDNDETPPVQDNEGGRKSIVTNVHTFVKTGHAGHVGGVALAGPRSRGAHFYAENCTHLAGAFTVSNTSSIRDAEAVDCLRGFMTGRGKSQLKDFIASGCEIGLMINDDSDCRVTDGLIEDGITGVDKGASLDRVFLRDIISRNNSTADWPAAGFAAALGVTVINCPGLRQSPGNLSFGPWNSIKVGSVPTAAQATVTAFEGGASGLHQTTFTFTGAHVPLAVAANGKAYGSLHIYDLLPTIPVVQAAIVSMSLSRSSAGVVGDWDGDFGIGTAAQGSNGTLENLEISIFPETATIQAPGLGADIIANGTFASAASWTTTTGWTIAGGQAGHAPDDDPDVPPTHTEPLSQAVALVANGFYRLIYTVSDRTAGTVTARFTGGASTVTGLPRSANATASEVLQAHTGNTTIEFVPSSDFDGKIDDVVLTGAARARGQMTTDKILGGASGLGSPNAIYFNFLVDAADHTVGTTPCDLILDGALTLTWIASGDYS